MTHQQIADILLKTDIFNLVSNDLIIEIIPQITVHGYKPEDTIFHKNEVGEKMYIMASGTAKIHDEDHILAKVEAGSYFGEFFLFDASPRSMSVTAIDEVSLLGINREVFEKILFQYPQIYNKIIALLIKRLKAQNSNTIGILKSREQELLRLVEERTNDLNKKTEELALKNVEITQSIIYAKRIQNAILPDSKRIKKSFPHSFFVYKPKDIVSGDFYSFFIKNDIHLIVIADCSGHGVSGAFMSMIGSSLLQQIIVEKEITKPSAILDQLHIAVIEALRQSESESNDGMDVAICAFNLKENKFQYAGANRPLWRIKNQKFEVVQADKIPIGGTQIIRDKTYSNHEFSIEKDESIYISTDGYADQFGGEQGKKMMTAKFKEVLLSIENLSMLEQEIFLGNYFDSWKGNNDQVDDVLVMGLKL